MAKIFSFNPKLNGSYKDPISNTLGVNTNGEFKKTEKGIAWLGNGADSEIDTGLAHAELDLTGNITITIPLKVNSYNAVQSYIMTNLKFVLFVDDDNKIYGFNDFLTPASSISIIKLGVWQFLTITRTSAGIFTFYVDSVDVTDDSIAGIPAAGTIDLYIGSREASRHLDGYIGKIEIWDEILSQSEINNLYKDFLRPKATGTSIHKDGYPIKASDLSRFQDNGLVAAYSMVPSPNRVLVDVSGNGNNGTINGAISTKNGMSFGKATDKVTYTQKNLGKIQTINFRWKANFGSQRAIILHEDNANYLSMYDTGIVRMRVSGGNDNGIQTLIGGFNIGHEYTVTFVRDHLTWNVWIDGIVYIGSLAEDNDFVYSQLGAYVDSTTFSPIGDINDLEIWNRALTDQEIKAYHNQFVNPVIISDFEYDGVSNFPDEYQKGTGIYSIQESVADGKYLENSVAGTCTIQSETAYGEWEFDISKAADGNLSYIHFIQESSSITGNGYRLQFKSDEKIELDLITNGIYDTDLFVTAASYIAINTWYRIKITRTEAGVFTVYIKGGAFGDNYVLVDVTGGSGTNPVTDNTYTTSKYAVLDLDTGDRFKGLKIINGIKQLN